MDENLFSADYVWLRVEGLRPSLDPVYEGPYSVIRRTSKYFVIAGYKGIQSVSVDRLKTAFLSSAEGEGVVSDGTQSDAWEPVEGEQSSGMDPGDREKNLSEPPSELDGAGNQLRPRRVRRAPRRLDL